MKKCISILKVNLKSIEFYLKNVVNIVSPDENQENNTKINKIKELISNEDTDLFSKEIKSSEFNRFNDNYLGENRYFKCQIVNNYSVINPITKLKKGIYKKKRIIDNPITWKQRVDINRPWNYN